jgi:hypothetical protein
LLLSIDPDDLLTEDVLGHVPGAHHRQEYADGMIRASQGQKQKLFHRRKNLDN